MQATGSLFPALAGLLLLVSCSVKENRRPCPCRLRLDLQESREKCRYQEIFLDLRQDGRELSRVRLSHEEREYRTMVSKGEVIAAASVAGDSWQRQIEAGAVFLPAGVEADTLFSCAQTVACWKETAEDTLRPHKQWCTVRLLLEKPEKWKDSRFEIGGKWAGLRITGSEPLEGELRFTVRKTGAGSLEARIPRQEEGGLSLRVFRRRQDGVREELQREFPLGTLLAAAGYDWRKPDLDDLELTLQDCSPGLSVRIENWRKGDNDSDVKL